MLKSLKQKDGKDSRQDADRYPMLYGHIFCQREPFGAQSPRPKYPEDQHDVNSDDGADTAIRAEKRLHGACLV